MGARGRSGGGGGRGGCGGLHRAAPWTTALVLASSLGATAWMRPASPEVGPYFDRVAERVHGVPYTLGTWVGRDAEVVPAARELLRPNAIVQRRYSRLEDGAWFDVILVHCGDVRDMQGHYPPVCYPAAGWEIDGGTPTVAGIGDRGVPATEYRAVWPHDRTVPPVRIVLMFAMPGDGVQFAREMGALRAAARTSARAEMGVLQVQVLTPTTMDERTRRELLPQVWRMLEPVVREVAGGPNADV